MASTGKTTNYELSQFIGTDKPSWLGDYNGDMLKIDTVLGSINATATTAQSGVASAQSAASAAQMTANAAQRSSNQNANKIESIENALNANLVQATPLNNGTSPLNISFSPVFVICKGSIQFPTLPTSTYVVGSNTRIPLWSYTGNLFKLVTSAITDTVNHFSVGVMTIRCNTSSQQNFITTFGCNAYFDGANTIFYTGITTSFYSTITALSNLWFNATSFLSGQTLNSESW